MNINQTLFNFLDEFGFWYDCYQHEVESFLIGNLPFQQRHQESEKLMRNILKNHGKDEIIGCLEELAIIEVGIRQLQSRARDHVVHSLLTFILGIYLNETLLSNNEGGKVDRFQWKLSGLLHDIGYPLELSRRMTQPYESKLNSLRRRFGATTQIPFISSLNDVEILSDGTNSLDLIQNQLNAWHLTIDVKKTYYSFKAKGIVCHGMISALTALNIIELMYANFNKRKLYKQQIVDNRDWNQSYFDNDIVPACSAIFVHNLSSDFFVNSKINLHIAPLPYLLVLADNLQEWERPSKENPMGYSSDNFDITHKMNNIRFTANIAKSRKKDIISSLNHTLVLENISFDWITQIANRKSCPD